MVKTLKTVDGRTIEPDALVTGDTLYRLIALREPVCRTGYQTCAGFSWMLLESTFAPSAL